MARIAVTNSRGTLSMDVPDEFSQVLAWLVIERVQYQSGKWDYSEEDLAHALAGLDEDSWFWQRGIENYAGRVRLAGVTAPIGLQALLKLVATLASMPEHLLRGGAVASLPVPGLPSGELL